LIGVQYGDYDCARMTSKTNEGKMRGFFAMLRMTIHIWSIAITKML
jgi:hypothetical protein